MKRRIIGLMLSATFAFAAVGCGSTTSTGDVVSQTESSVDSVSDITENGNNLDQEAAIEESKAEETDTDVSVDISGTWQSATIADIEKEYPAEFYVQFTETEIQYGSMTDEGEFTLDHSDKVNSCEVSESGIVKVKAESANGVQYTYMTSEDDATVMEYYETWNEEEFSSTYSAGASIMLCN